MITKHILATGACAAAAVLLTGCGMANYGPSYAALGTHIQANAHGTVTLLDNQPQNILGNGVRTPAGGNSTAKVELNATFEKGAWQIAGSWRDGMVQFTFDGWALDSLIVGADGIPGLAGPQNQVAPRNRPQSSQWVNGGCMPFATYYTSTNRAHPGTGIAIFDVCQKGTGGISSWDGPNTIEVVVPDTTTMPGNADASPYVNYVSGGTMGRDDVKVRVRIDANSPTSTPAPIFASPTAS